MKNEEIKLLDIQSGATIIFIATLVINLLLAYNAKLKLLNLPPIFSQKNEYEINLYNRIIVFGIALAFVYTSYRDYELSKTPRSKKFNELELIASFLVLIGSIIVLYVAVNDKKFEYIETENPSI